MNWLDKVTSQMQLYQRRTILVLENLYNTDGEKFRVRGDLENLNGLSINWRSYDWSILKWFDYEL